MRKFMWLGLAGLVALGWALAFGGGNEVEVQDERGTMFTCTIDRCQDSGDYGKRIADVIQVWQYYDPNRGEVVETLPGGELVRFTESIRVRQGPGGLWYHLEDGWVNDYWLSKRACTIKNLSVISFESCAAGQY